MKKLLLIFVAIFLFVNFSTVFGEVSYTLRVLNQEVIGSNFYFEIWLQSTGDDLRLGPSDIYLDFNDGNFTNPVLSTTEWGTAMNWYTKAVDIDENDRIVISIGALFFETQEEFNARVALISTIDDGTYLGRFQLTNITNYSGTAGLAWYYSGTAGTDLYYYDNSSPWATHQITSYVNVDPEDYSLPVVMTNLLATANRDNGVVISWTTESETECAGFHIWRSKTENGEYTQINQSMIPGQGNSTNAHNYSYTDRDVQSEVIYWYKVEEISIAGVSEFYGPVAVEGIKPVPTTYDLAQNFPNPFNPVTTINYQLPEEVYVSIAIYSLLGVEVRELIAENQEPGDYSITWDGSDESGTKLASGIYFIHMKAGNFTSIRKMTLMK